MIKKLDKDQALIVMGFTGITTINFNIFHGDVEKRLGYPVFTHTFASKEFREIVKKIYEKDFLEMVSDT